MENGGLGAMNMSTRVHHWLSILVFVAVACSVAEIGRGQPTTVTIDVTVATEQGAPLEGMLITAFGDAGQWTAEVTGSDGVVSLQIERPSTYQSIVLALAPPDFNSVSPEMYAEQEMRLLELMGLFWFRGVYVIDLIDGQAMYDANITAFEAVSVRGRLVYQGQPLFGAMALLGSLWDAESDRDTGEFVIGGVQLGTPALIFISRGYGQEEFHAFDATQTMTDIDMGDVELNPAVNDSRLDLDITQWDMLDLRGRSRAPSVTLVRDDGTYAISLKLDTAGRACLFRTSVEPLSIPAGTYYISPGPVGPDPVSTRLINLVRDGVVDLDAAGLPKLTAIAGQVTTIQVDAPTAEAAIMNAGG